MHMAKSNILKFERDNLKMIFDALDEEKDGEIELKEFLSEMKNKFDIIIPLKEMEQIIKQVDLDYDGKVQFSEFLIATCNKRILFREHNLRECFKYMDANGDGVVTESDLKEFLGGEVTDSYVSDMMFAVDKNYDGQMEYDEFSNMMLKILVSSERNM